MICRVLHDPALTSMFLLLVSCLTHTFFILTQVYLHVTQITFSCKNKMFQYRKKLYKIKIKGKQEIQKQNKKPNKFVDI